MSEPDTAALYLGDIDGTACGNPAGKVRAKVKNAAGVSVLLYGLEKFTRKNIIAASGAALKAAAGEIKIELPARAAGMETLVSELFALGVHEVFIVLADVRDYGDDVALKNAVADAEEECAAGRLKGRFGVAAGAAAGAKKRLASILTCGIKHVIIDAGECPKKERREIREACARESEERDAVIEVVSGDERWAYRGQSSRRSEAEKLFLDLPSYKLGGRRVPLGTVFQLGFACNQKCVFCTADRTLPRVTPGVKKEKIEYALSLGAPRVVFTGGEPTLDPDLPEMIEKFRAAGVPEIAVYTNGMAFSEPGYAAELAAAGLNFALVSLHSSKPKIADRITGRSGGFTKTAAGIKALLKEDVFVSINFVINGLNYREAPEFAGYVARNFPGAALNFSYIAPISDESARAELVPKFSDAVPYLAETLSVCEELGVDAAGLEPHWGVPPCALGDIREKYLPLLPPLARPYKGFVKPDSCAKCVLCRSCPGVREKYAQLYGTDELIPLKK